MNNEASKSGAAGGILGMLKDALFESEPAKSPESAANAPAPSQGTSPAATKPIGNSPMVDRMMQVVLGRTTAYTALLEAMAQLEAFIPDEASRYKAAFAIVGKTRTLEQIVQSIDLQHLPELDAESQRFATQAKDQEEKLVGSKIRELEALKTSIQAAEDERKRLEARLLELNVETEGAKKKIASTETEVAMKRHEIASVNQQFEETAVAVRVRLADAKTKVLRYLSS